MNNRNLFYVTAEVRWRKIIEEQCLIVRNYFKEIAKECIMTEEASFVNVSLIVG